MQPGIAGHSATTMPLSSDSRVTRSFIIEFYRIASDCVVVGPDAPALPRIRYTSAWRPPPETFRPHPSSRLPVPRRPLPHQPPPPPALAFHRPAPRPPHPPLHRRFQ